MTYFAYLCICSGPSSLGHSAVAAICKKCRTSEDVFYTSDRAQKISRGAACLLLALQGQAASKVQPSGYGHGSATWHRQGGFQLRIDNVWFCKVLFLFSFVSQNDLARKRHDCAFVSVLEEYKGRRRPGSIYLHIFYLYAYFTYSAYFFQNGLIG